ncbi:hypothetical protein XELAEV_18045159mg [Xenopus laevis]|uniref:Uncharacterized protein n=1 Tax=Xenopus laevis TaxID=8355 RepID=A0A974C040_XENLA|nr:hypothetical protein XELAEV_18045159mg [Xenopus laevis]
MNHYMAQDMKEELGSLLGLVPSPQSEAVAHDFQELSLQSVPPLPPLKERKNGEWLSWQLKSEFVQPALDDHN